MFFGVILIVTLIWAMTLHACSPFRLTFNPTEKQISCGPQPPVTLQGITGPALSTHGQLGRGEDGAGNMKEGIVTNWHVEIMQISWRQGQSWAREQWWRKRRNDWETSCSNIKTSQRGSRGKKSHWDACF